MKLNSEILKQVITDLRYFYLVSLLLIVAVILVEIFVVRRQNKKKKTTAVESETPAPEEENPGLSFSNGFYKIEIGNCQGTGEREEQQDAFGFSPNSKWEKQGFLAVLCDGMGGLDAGADISNKLVADIIAEFPYSFDKLKEGWILDSLSADIFDNYRGRGGTTAIITFLKDDKMWFASVGDSDLLLYRDGRLYPMNQRQEYGNDLLMRAADGLVGMDQALASPDAPALTEYMGGKHANPDFSVIPWQVQENDVYLLCSDGVSDTLSFEEIRECMTHRPDECAQLLERGIMTKNKRYQDNYTAIVFAVRKLGGIV